MKMPDVRTRARVDLSCRFCAEDLEHIRAQSTDADVARAERIVERHSRLLNIVFDALERWSPMMRRSGMFGATFRARDEGDFATAHRIALAGAKEARQAQQGFPPDSPHRDFWSFLVEAANAAHHLRREEACASVWWLALDPLLPIEGYHASEAMLSLSRLLENAGRRDDAVRAARWSVGADPTWAAPSIWAARLGLRGAPFDVRRMLRDAVAIDPTCRVPLTLDPDFVSEPGLAAMLQAAHLRMVPRPPSST